MTSKIDGTPTGWTAWHPKEGFQVLLIRPSPAQALEDACIATGHYVADASFSAASEVLEADFYDAGWQIKPVKIIPHDVWEKLMEWCDECASNADGGQWELRVKLHKILTEVETQDSIIDAWNRRAETLPVKNLPDSGGAE